MIIRIGFNLLVLASILALPWQSTALILLAGFFLFDNYFEGLVWALALDLTFTSTAGITWWYTTYVLACYLGTSLLKPQIRMYD